jgi:hypothetical protein
MARGLRTLWHFRALLNPARYGAFAWMLASHKLARWLAPWALLGALAAVAWLGWLGATWARLGLAAAGAVAVLALGGWSWPARRPAPRILALTAYVVSGTVAALHAWLFAARGRRSAMWEPTRRVLTP